MKYIYKLFLALYLVVGIVPNFEAIDKVVTQWFYLNLLNTIALLFIFVNQVPLKKILLNKSSILFISLFVWSSLTLFVSINQSESLVALSQLFALVLGFIVLTYCISNIQNAFGFISSVLSVYLVFELGAIYIPFLIREDLDLNLIFTRSAVFLGFAANVNITAFSVLYKVPFLVYSLLQLKKFKNISIVFLATPIFLLVIFASGTLNSTRAAILTYTILAPILVFVGTIIYVKSKQNRLLILSVSYTVSLLLSFPLNFFLSDSLGKSESNISNRISTLTALVDQEEKKDGSLTQRINFYSQATNFIFKNPILGTGIGNWKIKSIDTNKKNIVGYQVPYHVHNDFLEIAAEKGLIGLGLYLAILFFGFKNAIVKFLKNIFTKSELDKNYLQWISISLYAFIFLIDSNLNFPFYRPIVIIILIVLLAYQTVLMQTNLNAKQG